MLERLYCTRDYEETKEIWKTAFESISKDRQGSFLRIAIKYGIPWNIIEAFVQSNSDDVINGYGGLTGLRLFMLAAMQDGGWRSDLSSIYGLMKMSPPC